MSKEIIISYSQAMMIFEGSGGGFGFEPKDFRPLIKEILTNAGEQIGENLQFMITWGASIAGIIGPLNDFINDKYPSMTNTEVSLLLTGIIANYYFDNKKVIGKIVKKIKESGLSDVFTLVYSKSEELKTVFAGFIESMNITTQKMSNILSYAFIIPIIPMIFEGVSTGLISEDQIAEICERLVAFGVVTVSGFALKKVVTKLIRRFSSM